MVQWCVHSQFLGSPTVQWTWGVQGKADVGEAPCTPSSQERKQTSSSFPCTGRGGVWRLEAASKNSAVSILFYGSQYFDIVVSQYKWQAMQNMVTCVTWPRSKADLTWPAQVSEMRATALFPRPTAAYRCRCKLQYLTEAQRGTRDVCYYIVARISLLF